MNWKFLLIVILLISTSLLLASPARASTYEQGFEVAQNLLKDGKARVVIYGTSIPKGKTYPDESQRFHEEYLNLAKTVEAPLAPSISAYMKFLGETPTPERFAAVYADWIDPAPKGTFLERHLGLSGQSR